MKLDIDFTNVDRSGGLYYTVKLLDGQDELLCKRVNVASPRDCKAFAREAEEKTGHPGALELVGRLLRDKATQELGDIPTPSHTTARQLIYQNPTMRPEVIPSLLREGETANLIGAPKSRKSWLAMDLAIHAASGGMWLGMFKLEPMKVRYIDNELHAPTSAARLRKIGEARGIPESEFGDRLVVDNLRGRLTDIRRMYPYFESLVDQGEKLIILDALYRFIPPDVDENSNSQMTGVYNLIDRYADMLKCAFVLVHHASKGNQGTKDVTDVGAGAGAQSRATDNHITIREHAESSDQSVAVVINAANRSFAPLKPFCLRWVHPVWQPDHDLDAYKLKQPNAKRKKEPAEEKPAKVKKVWTASEFVSLFATDKPQTRDQMLTAAEMYSQLNPDERISGRKAESMLSTAESEGLIFRVSDGPKTKATYSTAKNTPKSTTDKEIAKKCA